MKKNIIFKSKFCYKIFLILLCFALFPLVSIRYVIADEGTVDSQTVGENVEQQLENLDMKELEEYLSGLSSFSGKSLKERLSDYISGEIFNYSDYFNGLKKAFLGGVEQMLPAFCTVFAVILLCGIFSSVKSGFLKKSTTQMIFLVGFISTLVPVLAILTDCLNTATESVKSMQKQMQLIFPILITLMTASGGSISASIFKPSVAFLSTAMVSLVEKIVFPLTITIIAFSIAANLSKELKLGKFADFFKSMNKWLLGICVSVFGVFFTAQGITGATRDGIARRAAKYAVGNGVPIVGGFLSSGFDLAIAGSILIKNSLGYLGIFLLADALMEPLLLLVSASLFLRLTAAVSAPFGDERISSFLTETANNIGYILAGLLFVAFLYFLFIVLAICSSEVIF